MDPPQFLAFVELAVSAFPLYCWCWLRRLMDTESLAPGPVNGPACLN